MQELEEALHLTMPRFGRIDIINWPLSRNEIFLLVNIAGGYYTLGRKKEAEQIYYALMDYIEQSSVNNIYYVTEYRLLAYNVGLMEGMEHNYNKSKEILEHGIESCMVAGRDEMLPSFLYCLGWVMREEGREENEEKARQILKQAFYLGNMLKLPKLCNEICNYYEEEWNEEII